MTAFEWSLLAAAFASAAGTWFRAWVAWQKAAEEEAAFDAGFDAGWDAGTVDVAGGEEEEEG